jgi:hypothetical protein
MTESDQGLNPFEAFDNTADAYAFMYSEYGADGLRGLLVTLLAMKEAMLTMEDLERDAQELSSIGLNPVAEVLLETAKDAPSGNVCPFDPVTDRANYRNWYRKRYNQFPDE